jgi:hypothetical protein
MSQENVEVVRQLIAALNERGGGVAFDQPITNVYELVAGKLRRVDVYFDREEALEAAGLRE